MMANITDSEIIALLEELQKFVSNKTNFVLANIYATLEQKELSRKFLAQVDEDFIDKNKLFSVAALTYLINSENTDKAYQLFSRAENVNANEEIALYLRSQNKLDTAFKFMQKARQDSLQATSYIFLADYYEQMAKIDSSLQILQTAASLFPDDADILNYYGYFIANQQLSRLYPKAEKLLQKAVELKPNSHYIWDSLAWLYVQQKKYSEAQKAFDKVEKSTINSSEEAYHLGYFYWKIQKQEKASYFLKMAINLNNDTDYVKKSEELLLKILEKDEK
jgi:tetratricopeptide (TPR) repeat protein